MEVSAYFKDENIVVKRNIAQIEQYFFWQHCFQMPSAALTNKSEELIHIIKTKTSAYTSNNLQFSVLVRCSRKINNMTSSVEGRGRRNSPHLSIYDKFIYSRHRNSIWARPPEEC